ncbi:mannan endo-1,4-beta-mannosidase B [Neocallimastix lanati (nom. inval.)]|nr:mannan endo-1,4-beta-mannosidase B [Neocallimastix sp. JGI-2020a]
MKTLNILLLYLSFIICAFTKEVYYEAENGKLNGVTVYKDLSGYSGSGYVGRFETAGNSVSVTVEVSQTGMYDLSIIYCGNMGQKINILNVNGEGAGDITFPETTGFETLNVGAIYLKAGKNTIGITSSWGWMWVDAFVINDTPNAAKDVSSKLNPTLVNPKAIPAAKKLYDFLKSNYGKRILSGQVGAAGQAGDEGEEFKRIMNATGKKPAVWNMDFIFESNDCTWRPTNPDITEMAINWWKKYQGKGIMSAQWHWNIAGKTGNFAFYKKDTTFDLEKAVTEGTWEYEKIIKDIDRVSGLIKKLQAINMPLIWRPLHENNGDWFWWGNNPKACAKLWKILYERMVNYHGLNNLIWLWNGNNDEYTPIEYIDIIGVDIYANDHGPQTTAYNTHFDFYGGKKMVVLSENGRIPDIQQCVDQGAWWGYFQTWNSEFILQNSYHTDAQLKEYFNHKIVMNMDELPSFNVNSYDYQSSGSNENNNNNNNNNNNSDSAECFSIALGYPCCKGNDIVYTDDDGNWGVENNEWCGINDSEPSQAACWSQALGYPCCKSTSDVYYTDDDGNWGVENGNWCGL